MKLMRATMVAVTWFLVASWSMAEEPLRYRFEAGQKVYYDIEIRYVRNGQTEIYQDLYHYVVDSVNGDTATLQFHMGGNARNQRIDANGQRLLDAKFLFSPKKISESSQRPKSIQITSLGKVTELKGNTDLPYFLGQLSTVPLVRLPGNDSKNWTVRDQVEVRLSGTHRASVHFDSSRGTAIAEFAEPIMTCPETVELDVRDVQGDIVTISQRYRMGLPPNAGNELTVTGSGTWAFDRATGWPASFESEYKAKIDIVSSGASMVEDISVKIHFRRIPEAEARPFLARREQAAAEAAKFNEAFKQRMADSETRRVAPLTAEEKTQVLTNLRSKESKDLIAALEFFAERSPKPCDPDVVAAVRALLKHSDDTIRNGARLAFFQIASEKEMQGMTFAELDVGGLGSEITKNLPAEVRGALEGDIDAAYRGPSTVPSSNRPVTEDTKLTVGEIVQIRHATSWYPAEVLALLKDKSVRIRFRGWSESWDKDATRSELQLAPDEVTQPSRIAAARKRNNEKKGSTTESPDTSKKKDSSSTTGRTRTWRDASGKFAIEATFLGREGDKVRLRTKEGREISVELSRLSSADQAAVEVFANLK